jgi:hypothetical protein
MIEIRSAVPADSRRIAEIRYRIELADAAP